MFGTMVSPDVLKHLENHPNSFELSPREGEFGFVVAQVAEGNPHRTRELVGKVVDLAVSHKAFVGQIISSIVMCHYGVIQNTDLSPMPGLISALHDQFGQEVRVVHGTFHGLFGNIGSACRFSYGPIFPDMTRVFVEITSLDFGQEKELKLT
jgi:hypothetical protein